MRPNRFLLAVLLLVFAHATGLTQQQAQQQGAKPAAKAPPTPEQKELERVQAEIGKLQKQARELRIKASAQRYKSDMERKKTDDELIQKLCAGNIGYQKISYRSSVGDMDIPAYLFQPLKKRGPKGHPALIWVHGGVAGNFGSSSIPLVRIAVDRGYIVIAPEFRGSTGYGEAFQEAIDYGGYEIDDTMTAYDYLKLNVPEADPARVGMIGWSHGGFITLHSLIRDQGKLLKCGYAGVPVTNLVFRLSYKGPPYEDNFVKQKAIGGEVHERRDIYIARSPVYHVHKIKVPVMVHVATNDQDVNFVEDEMMIHALEYHLPRLAETKIYIDPPGGHSFDRLVNRERTALQNTPPQRDSLNRVWAFLEEHLKPYLDGEGKVILP
jgi:dipeptidyl aminopeptidase/acylaminoacyl peptidase